MPRTRKEPPSDSGVALAPREAGLALQSPNDESTPPSPDSGPSMSTQYSRLAKLPAETLLTIARELPKNADLCQLSLVCRKLRDVSQEALVKEVFLPSCGMRELIRTLCDRPDLCVKVTSVDLDNYIITGCPKGGMKVEEWSHFSKCWELVGSETFGDIARYLDFGNAFHLMWPKAHQFFLDVLLAACPNINELSLRLPVSRQDQLQVVQGNVRGKLANPFSGVSRRRLSTQLRTLTIRESGYIALFQTPNVALSSFSRLVCLSIAIDALVYITQENFDIEQVFPRSLQRLQLRPCNRDLQTILPALRKACFHGVVPELRQIDCYLETCVRDTLSLIDQGTGSLKTVHAMAGLLEQTHGVSLQAYNNSEKYLGNLLEELDAWSVLSESERWCPHKKGEEFSSIVARTDEGFPRRRSENETRAFVRRHRMPRLRVRGPKYIFNPNVNIQNTATLSFFADADEVPRVTKAEFTSEFVRWSASVAIAKRKKEYALRSPRTDSQPRNFDHSLSGNTGPNTHPNVTYTFQGTSDINPLHLEFDATHWDGHRFFDAPPSISGNAFTPPPPQGRANGRRRIKAATGTKGARRVKAKLQNGE